MLSLKNIDYSNNIFETSLLIIVSILELVFSILLNKKSNSTLDAISKYKYIQRVEAEGDIHTPNEELKCIELSNNVSEIKNVICNIICKIVNNNDMLISFYFFKKAILIL